MTEANLLSDQSALIQLLLAYGLGFIASFTPCVFPLIPITLSLFGARECSSHFKGFLLACSYVGGIAATYTILGMVSAKLGVIFGSALGNPWVVLCLCIFLIMIALYTFEMLNLPFLGTLQTGACKVGGKGYGGAFLMGTVSGFVAAPCMGPALLVILGAAAASHNVAWSAALLFSYSIGLGTIFIALGTFSNLISKLPKSGNWLNAMKFFLGTLLFMVVIFIAERFLDFILNSISLPNYSSRLIILENLGIFLGWYSYRHDKKVLRLIASVFLALSLYQIFVATPHAASPIVVENLGQPASLVESKEISWLPTIEEAIAKSKSENKIVMLDLYADWCVACKEMDSQTFSKAQVKSELSKIILARIDFTDTSSPAATAISERYGVPGLPTILFLKSDGSGDEIKDSRITGFTQSEEFLAHLAKLNSPLLP